MLIVITIIALLVAILLPAVKRAKQHTRTVICASNQRQIGLSLMQYAEDYEGWLPRPWDTSVPQGFVFRDWGIFWPEMLWFKGYFAFFDQRFEQVDSGEENLGDYKAKILCPSGPRPYWMGDGRECYGMNADNWIRLDGRGPWSRYPELTAASDRIVLLDSVTVDSSNTLESSLQYYWVAQSIGKPWAVTYHLGTTNGWFADGHAASMRPAELGKEHLFQFYFDWDAVQVLPTY